MTQKELQLRKLILLLQNLDSNLLQRATDYIKGLSDAVSEKEYDWWAELPESVKQDIEEGLLDIENGNLIPMEEVMKKYNN
jgi:predicted transcriptional regulator